MDTIDFIRYQTRVILREEKPSPQGNSADYRGKYSKSVRTGRISGEAKKALGLAGSNPRALLSNLGIAKYQTAGNSRAEEIVNFFETVRKSNAVMGAAFEKPSSGSNHIDIPVFLLGGEVPAIKQTQAPRYVKALLLAGHSLGIVDFDIERNSVSLRSVESEEENADSGGKQFFVRLSLK